MSDCNWNVESIVPDLSDEQIQDIICLKIANVLIKEEMQNCTLENQN